ncbi:WGR domain-containing protein [Pleionea sp. CnH1-48]|uniref:WGR domain-containing protein n=1 Tax=Pleionea sp. CnH1-48 TaxID=2954494 RepID=UPI002096D207|nr:WGR domain-containing protein [Pleionea sp. CnH1-48]MCO7225106.1 WGR domain-containing protein [Pleionea sp. CnH1-48]
MKLIKKTRLHYQDDRSDKIYEVDLVETTATKDKRFLVNFRYGRSGHKLRESTKTTIPVTLEEAQRLFDSLIVSKLNKGYIDISEAPKTPPVTENANATALPSQAVSETQVNTLLTRLNSEAVSKRRSRIIWRLGEIGASSALSAIKKYIGSGHWLEDYSITWAIGRCGSHDDLADLEHLTQSKHKHVSQLAHEALLCLLEPSERQAQLNSQLASLPEPIKEHISEPADRLYGHLDACFSEAANKSYNDWLVILYQATLIYPQLHTALLQLLRKLPIKPGYFKGIRHLYKIAEMRQDAAMLGILALRFDATKAFFNNEYDWTYLPDVGSLTPSKELKKPNARLAYSGKTRTYFQRRTLRQLRRLAASDDPRYLDLATGILTAITDEDAVPAKTIKYYDWSSGGYTDIEYGPFAHFLAFNYIIYGNSSNYRLKKTNRAWIKTGEETHQERTENHPQMWDRNPEKIIVLLLESRCYPVHQCALRMLQEHPDTITKLTAGQLAKLLEKPYQETAKLALEQVKNRLSGNSFNKALSIALLNSVLDEARELATQYLNNTLALWYQDEQLLCEILASKHKEILNWISEIDYPTLEPTIQIQILKQLIAHYQTLSAVQPEQVDALIHFAEKNLPQALAEVEVFTISHLLKQSSLGLRYLAAQLTLKSQIPFEAIPTEIYQTISSSAETLIRSVGISLLGKQSDDKLLLQPNTVLTIFLNGESEERLAAATIIQRLLQASSDFGEHTTDTFVNAAFRGEAKPGLHDDLVELFKANLSPFWNTIDKDQLWRMLQAQSQAAQRIGAIVLSSREASAYSVKQWAILANHSDKQVRLWSHAAYQNHLPKIAEDARNALRIFDSQWQDTQTFAEGYFRKQFDDTHWTPELIVFLCDNNNDHVQAFGKEILQTFFEHEQGQEYLEKLSQHPSENVQLFASQFLQDYASGKTDIILELKSYFVTVLSQVNKARVCKDRIFAFLMTEANDNRKVAEMVADIFTRQSITLVMKDKSTLIQNLLKLKLRYPDLSLPLHYSTKPIWQSAKGA